MERDWGAYPPIHLQPLTLVISELTPLCLRAVGLVAPARSQDFCIWAPSAPLWDVCPDVKALRGAAGMFNQELFAEQDAECRG